MKPPHHHPLSWFMEGAELIIDAGVILVVLAIAGVVIFSLFVAPGHPTYLD